MNRIMCFLTGGHRYRGENIETATHPHHSGWVLLSNRCVKCGKRVAFALDVDCQIKLDLIAMGVCKEK